jgi:phosphomevalonate kinase
MLLGIHGKQGAGKDELTKILLKELAKYSIIFTRRGLADTLKSQYCEMLGITLEELEENKSAHRAAMQDLGQTMRENIPDYWIGLLEENREDGENTVIPDVRYENEFRYSGSRGMVFKVVADEAVRASRRPIINPDHISETALDHYADDMFDHIFINNGSIEELKEQVVEYLTNNLDLFAKAFPPDYRGLGA